MDVDADVSAQPTTAQKNGEWGTSDECENGGACRSNLDVYYTYHGVHCRTLWLLLLVLTVKRFDLANPDE